MQNPPSPPQAPALFPAPARACSSPPPGERGLPNCVCNQRTPRPHVVLTTLVIFTGGQGEGVPLAARTHFVRQPRGILTLMWWPCRSFAAGKHHVTPDTTGPPPRRGKIFVRKDLEFFKANKVPVGGAHFCSAVRPADYSFSSRRDCWVKGLRACNGEALVILVAAWMCVTSNHYGLPPWRKVEIGSMSVLCLLHPGILAPSPPPGP